MFRDRSWNEHARWARQLEVLRYVRGCGGHDVTPDRFIAVVKLPPGGLADVLSAVGATDTDHPSQGTLYAKVAGVATQLHHQTARVELAVWPQAEDIYTVTEADFDAALAVDACLRRSGLEPIDPPQDSEYCICPKYYPAMWAMA
jgi:hypothetical protein